MFTANQIGVRILLKIISHLGQQESPNGSNSGHFVTPRLKFVGVANKNPWCAAEASYDTYYTLEGMGNDLLNKLDILKTASSHEAVDWAIRHKTIQAWDTVVPGDWCIERGGDGDPAKDGFAYHHTTIVEWIDYENMIVHWIAGNTRNMVARGECKIADCTLLRPYAGKLGYSNLFV